MTSCGEGRKHKDSQMTSLSTQQTELSAKHLAEAWVKDNVLGRVRDRIATNVLSLDTAVER